MSIPTIHVIFKTHLDVGFTDFADRVIQRYRDEFIPCAIDLAADLGTGERGFRWTAGSWILEDALTHGTPEQRARVETALAGGALQWHALPFTFQTELLDERLFEHGLSYGRRLDARFGTPSRVAKMTDVPGHTIGIVPLLARAGVEFLHVGINPASELPEVPHCFVWRAPDGSEIVVIYDSDYGSTESSGAYFPEGSDQGLFFSFTNDNHGPHERDDVLALYDELERAYPDHRVVASSLDDFWSAIAPVRGSLPVVTGEIGDSWIHGTASDPVQLSRLTRLKRALADAPEGRVDAQTADAMSRSMLLVTEHTWGMNHQKFLPDFASHRQPRFEEARARDEFDGTVNPPDLRKHVYGEAPYRYSTLEASWAEQRGYTDRALAIAQEAGIPVGRPEPPVAPDDATVTSAPDGTQGSILGWRYVLGPSGALTRLDRDDVTFADPEHVIGEVGHEGFVSADYERYLTEYVRDLDRTGEWARSDLGRLGLERVDGELRHTIALPRLATVTTWVEGDTAYVQAGCAMPAEAVREYGAAARVTVTYRLEPSGIGVQVTLGGRRASRMPQATWVRIDPATAGDWRFRKLGTVVDPRDVVPGGNPHLHAIEVATATAPSGGEVRVIPLDAVLATPGRPRLLRSGRLPAEVDGGPHFVLTNNLWSTNYRLWTDGDLTFDVLVDRVRT